MTLARNFAMANFLNPNLADNLNAPQNIYGRNVKKSEKQARDKQAIKSLIPKIELFVFREENCSHCPLLEKHLNSFANKYGFKVEAVSADNSQSKYFKTHNNPAITKALNLTLGWDHLTSEKEIYHEFDYYQSVLKKIYKREYSKLSPKYSPKYKTNQKSS